MPRMRLIGAAMLQRGQLTRGWYRILTGLAMLVAADMLYTARESDRVAGPVALVLLVTGIVLIGTGAALERRDRVR